MSLVEIKDLCLSYGSHAVLNGVSMSLEEHEVVCLIGPSGCGKSSLLRCINRLEDPHAGSITIDGEEVTGVGVDVNSLRKKVGIVFQSFNLFPHLSIRRNLTLGPEKLLGLTKREANDQALDLLERFGLPEKIDDYPDHLSGGQQQRVAMARALAMRPKVLLLDEVTSALDPELVYEVLSAIRQLARDGMTMMIATHELNFARSVASKVMFLYEGVVHEEGPPSEVLVNPQRERTAQFVRRLQFADED